MFRQQAGPDLVPALAVSVHKFGSGVEPATPGVASCSAPTGSCPFATTALPGDCARGLAPAAVGEFRDATGMSMCSTSYDKVSSSALPLQYDDLQRQELSGSVAAAAALHYQQQQSMQVRTPSSTSNMISVATLQGLQDQHEQTLHSVQGGVGVSSTVSGAPTAILSYLGDPKNKAGPIAATTLQPPAATAGVSSLYGRLRNATLTDASAASRSVPSTTTVAPRPSFGGGTGQSADKACSSKCQILSHPQLWTPATAVACNAGIQPPSVAAGDQSDYLSLLMAATKLSKGADAADLISEHYLGTVALNGTANVQRLPGDASLDPGQERHLLQQLQDESTRTTARRTVSPVGVGDLSTLIGDGIGQPAAVDKGSLLSPAPASVPGGLLMQGQLLRTGLQPPGSQSSLLCHNTAGLLRAPPCPASTVTASNVNSTLEKDRAQTVTSALVGSAHKPDGLNNPLYKTELCRTWAEIGSCRYGARCQFAHGQAELRAVVRPPKYKTQPCRTYSLTGKCPYGARCNFIHDGEDDETLLNRNNKSDWVNTSSSMILSRLGSGNCPASMMTTPGAALLLGANSMPGSDAASLAGVIGGATAAGLWGSMTQGSAASADLGSLPGYCGVLSDDSFSSSLSAVSMNGAVNGLSIQQAAMHSLGGLGTSVTVDRGSVVNYAAGNGVLGTPAALIGLADAGGVFGNVLG